MLKSFKTPTPLQLAKQQLLEAQNNLLQGETWAEHYQHTVVMLQQRVTRLQERVLLAAYEQQRPQLQAQLEEAQRELLQAHLDLESGLGVVSTNTLRVTRLQETTKELHAQTPKTNTNGWVASLRRTLRPLPNSFWN